MTGTSLTAALDALVDGYADCATIDASADPRALAAEIRATLAGRSELRRREMAALLFAYAATLPTPARST